MALRVNRFGISLLAFIASVSASNPAFAQQAASPAEATSRDAVTDDIIVTARRRDETSLSAPVAVAGLTGQQLATRGIVTMEGFARTVPSLIMGEGTGSQQGGVVSLRGISAGDGNPFSDQAVAFNIDGVQVARSSVRRMSEMDLEQIEVLKGPQALYFGKNSPAGIVVIRTADPGSTLEAGLKSGYEFVAREIRSEGFISVPVTDSFGVRIAASGSTMRGWSKNEATASVLYGPLHRYAPHTQEYAGRITLKFDDGGPFDARLKLASSVVKNRGPGSNGQRVDCPYGLPHASTVTVGGVPTPANLGGPDDCKANDTVVKPDLGTSFNRIWPLVGDGVPNSRQTQTIGGLELNYDLNSNLTVTSLTGYYRSKYHFLENLSASDTQFTNQIFGADTYLNIRELSQELRLASDFDGPFNFLLGGYFQDTHLKYATAAFFNPNSPTFAFVPNASTQDGTAWSVFASGSFKITPTIELSGGGRYSYERKLYNVYRLLRADGSVDVSLTGTPFDPTLPGGSAVTRRKFNDFSPEATLTWRPTDRLTVYGSYKRGFLSGGFQTGSGNLALDQSYLPQKVSGVEGGVKGRFLDGALRANLALYYYKITDQQVTITIAPNQVTTNAASSRAKGVEFDYNWTTPLEGLSFRGGASYNSARYLSFPAGVCYAGQTVAMGCSLLNGNFVQNLGGKVIPRAPKWGLFGGSTFEVEDGGGRTWGLTADANYTTGYYAEATNKPGAFQHGYWLLDASAYVKLDQFQISLIGRNLTNTYYFQRTIDGIFTGAANATRTQGVLADTVGFVSRGREVALQLSYRFGK